LGRPCRPGHFLSLAKKFTAGKTTNQAFVPPSVLGASTGQAEFLRAVANVGIFLPNIMALYQILT